MGLFSSSCITSWHSKIAYLTESCKGNHVMFSSLRISTLQWSKKSDTNDTVNLSMNVFTKYHQRNKPKKSLNHEKFSDKFIKPKTMPRYDFVSQKSSAIFNEEFNEQSFQIPVVLIDTVLLKQPNNNVCLPLGTVLNVICKQDDWLYVQTADGQEGFVDYNACISLEIFSLNSKETIEKLNFQKTYQKDIFSILENLNKMNSSKAMLQCTEKNFDFLYLQLTKNKKQDIRLPVSEENVSIDSSQKYVVLIIKTDFCSKAKNTLTVKKGDIVFLIHCCIKGWFWVKNESDMEGYIPAVTAGYWCF